MEGEMTSIGENIAEKFNSYQDSDNNGSEYDDSDMEEDVDEDSVEGLDIQVTTVTQSRTGNIHENSQTELDIQIKNEEVFNDVEDIEKWDNCPKVRVAGLLKLSGIKSIHVSVSYTHLTLPTILLV